MPPEQRKTFFLLLAYVFHILSSPGITDLKSLHRLSWESCAPSGVALFSVNRIAAILAAMKPQATHGSTPQPSHATPRQRREQIVRLCAVIAREFQPDKIILFGSWAYGTLDTDSDIDLLVVMPFEGSPFRQAGTILNH